MICPLTICIFHFLGSSGSSRRTPYGHTPLSMTGSISGATPYTPGATPANLISDDEAAKIMQQAFPVRGAGDQTFNNLTSITTPTSSTPGYSTPGFSTPGGFTPRDNLTPRDNNLTPRDNSFTPRDNSLEKWGNENQSYEDNESVSRGYNSGGHRSYRSHSNERKRHRR